MSKGQRKPKNWHEALELITRCPLCQTTFEALSVRLVSRNSQTNKVHLTCKQCQSYALVLITMLPAGISSVGMLTDLSFNDAVRLDNLEAITTDELIDSHQFLKTNSLSMARLKLIPEK